MTVPFLAMCSWGCWRVFCAVFDFETCLGGPNWYIGTIAAVNVNGNDVSYDVRPSPDFAKANCHFFGEGFPFGGRNSRRRPFRSRTKTATSRVASLPISSAHASPRQQNRPNRRAFESGSRSESSPIPKSPPFVAPPAPSRTSFLLPATSEREWIFMSYPPAVPLERSGGGVRRKT